MSCSNYHSSRVALRYILQFMSHCVFCNSHISVFLLFMSCCYYCSSWVELFLAVHEIVFLNCLCTLYVFCELNYELLYLFCYINVPSCTRLVFCVAVSMLLLMFISCCICVAINITV